MAERLVRQTLRERERAESFVLRSKQAILGTNRELQASIQDLERITDELREAKSRAERASEAKGRFVATISHELRTPMNGILGTAELLTHAKLPPADAELVAIIERSARGLLAIISDVLDFTKAESGRIQLESTHFDLHGTLRALVDLELNVALKKRIDLELVIAPGTPQFVLGDPVRLRQVLLNLLDNAVKFTSVGGVTLMVRPAAGRPGILRFEVRDTGIGIEPSVQRSIFDPFVQADDSTTRRFGGSGLGLAICKHIVELMDGDLVVESQPGRGSTFRFECALPEAAGGRIEPEPPAPAAQNPLGMHVLVVDDNAVNRTIALRMLKWLGCTADSCSDGREAIELASAADYDAVLMDCAMPDVDGYQATAAIRTLSGPRGRVPIVAVTAHALAGDRDQCLAARMDDYLTKPIQIAELRAALVRNGERARDPVA